MSDREQQDPRTVPREAPRENADERQDETRPRQPDPEPAAPDPAAGEATRYLPPDRDVQQPDPGGVAGGADPHGDKTLYTSDDVAAEGQGEPLIDQGTAQPDDHKARATTLVERTARDLRQAVHGGERTRIEVGTVVDRRFVLEKKLGEGGMGYVFRARDLVKEEAQDPHPHVAIKILRAEFSAAREARVALQREAKKAQSLAHPRIATVHDFQIDRESGLCFISMEQLQGMSLDVFMRKHPDGLEDRSRATSILLSIADGLEYAHRHGIIHSDLKPSNVFINEKGEVKILDFGIARSMPGTDADEFDAGSLGALTPSYASCEMFERQPPHPSDDMYALGVIAYELITGRHPFEEVLDEREPAIAARELEITPTRPPGLKRNQWRAISQCLLHEREQRPGDAGVFLSDFRRRNPLPRLMGAALLLSSLLLVWAVWFREPVLEPDIPFSQLPAEIQEEFNVTLEEGWMVFQHKDYNGALLYFLQAHDIHPRNAQAIEGLQAVVDVVIGEDLPEDRIALETKLQQVNALLSYDALSEDRQLIRFRERLRERLAN